MDWILEHPSMTFIIIIFGLCVIDDIFCSFVKRTVIKNSTVNIYNKDKDGDNE